MFYVTNPERDERQIWPLQELNSKFLCKTNKSQRGVKSIYIDYIAPSTQLLLMSSTPKEMKDKSDLWRIWKLNIQMDEMPWSILPNPKI